MTKMGLISSILICIGLLCWSVMPVSALMSSVIGETVHLSGKGGGYDEMYLFLTGPNLAPGGVRLDSVTRPVVSGTAASFTFAPVRSGVWEYNWDTGRTGGTLDPGIYLVWVSPEPLDRYDIRRTSYATISIRLTTPALTADISGNLGNGAPEETVTVTADETAEEVTPVSDQDYSEDRIIIGEVIDGTKCTQEASEGAIPQETTAGSLLCPFICATGTGMVLLLITKNNINC